MQLQELITRGRIIFSGAPKRLEVFSLINGKRSSKKIARKMGRTLSSVLKDIQKIRDMELIREKTDSNGNIMKMDDGILYEKVPILRHMSISYFKGVNKIRKPSNTLKARMGRQSFSPLAIPLANDVLDICKNGESQLYEFKDPRVATQKITKEIAAFLHTKLGGIIFYGVEDDGSIVGSAVTRQSFDQSLQNSVRNTISPQPTIRIVEKKVLGHIILIILIPPWDRKTMYQYTKDQRFYIRRGTNIFAITPDEVLKLAKGQFIV